MNNLSRRGLLRVGLFGSAALTTAGLLGGLSGCSAEGPAKGFLTLRDSDLPMLRRVTQLVLQGAVPEANTPAAVEGTLQSLDQGLALPRRHWPHQQGRRHHHPSRPSGRRLDAGELDLQLPYANADACALGA